MGGTFDTARSVGRRGLACAVLLCLAGQARAQVEPAVPPPEGPAEPAPPGVAPARGGEAGTPAPPAGRRATSTLQTSLVLLGGPAWFADGEVEVLDMGVLAPDVVAREQVAYRPGAALVLRLEAWVHPRLAVALELAETKASADRVDLRLTTLSLVPMARLPLLRTAGQPEGLVRLHLGLALTAAVEGSGGADFPAVGRRVSGDVLGFGPGGTPSLGAGVLAGVSLHLGPVAILLEQRFSTLHLTLTDLFERVSTTLDARQTMLGVAVRL